MKAYKCDRCGKLFEGYEGQGTRMFYTIITDPCSTGSCLDLCFECNNELREWIRKVESEDNEE